MVPEQIIMQVGIISSSGSKNNKFDESFLRKLYLTHSSSSPSQSSSLLSGGFTQPAVFVNFVRRDSSVGITNLYGFHGPGIKSRWRRDFPLPYRPVLEPTQPPIQSIPDYSRG
jgi:hypothetical protein